MNRCGLSMAVLLIAGAAVVAAQDLDTNYQTLQEAVAKKDVATIKKLAAETSAMARQEIAKPDETDPDALKKRLEDLHAIDTYTEYALYATAAQSDAPVMVPDCHAGEAEPQEQISGPGLWAVPGSSRQGRLRREDSGDRR